MDTRYENGFIDNIVKRNFFRKDDDILFFAH